MVENLADLEGPPLQMEYINAYKVRTEKNYLSVSQGGGGGNQNDIFKQ
jgi:hypothetical protein